MKKGLVLLAHGSRNPNWRKTFDDLIDDLQHATKEVSICLAHLQMSEPSLPAVIDRLVSQGIEHICILPMLMAGGKHTREDIPAAVTTLRETYPAIRMELLSPIGSHPRFKAMMHELVAEEL